MITYNECVLNPLVSTVQTVFVLLEPGFDGVSELQNYTEEGYLELLLCRLPAALDSLGVEEQAWHAVQWLFIVGLHWMRQTWQRLFLFSRQYYVPFPTPQLHSTWKARWLLFRYIIPKSSVPIQNQSLALVSKCFCFAKGMFSFLFKRRGHQQALEMRTEVFFKPSLISLSLYSMNSGVPSSIPWFHQISQNLDPDKESLIWPILTELFQTMKIIIEHSLPAAIVSLMVLVLTSRMLSALLILEWKPLVNCL